MQQRTRWAGAGAATVAALALTGCDMDVDFEGNVTEETRTDSYARAEVLELTNQDGATTVVGGDVSEITVERRLRYTGDTPPEETVTEQDGTLAITAGDCGSRIALGIAWCDIDYVVTVPEGTAVSVGSADGAITVDDTGGEVTVVTTDGEVVVTGTVEKLDATTRDGVLTLDQVEADTVTAETVDGRIEATGGAAETVALANRDGRVRVDGTEFGELDVDTGDGTVEITAATAFDRVDVKARDGGVTVLTPPGAGPYAVTTSTGDGAVDVSVPQDTDAESVIRVTTVDGAITVGEA